MRTDLEKTVGFHRRLKGVGKSLPNDPTGVFDFKWRACKHDGARIAVCDLSLNKGIYRLHIVVHQQQMRRTWPRSPSFHELERIMPLFFYADQYPVQFHDTKARSKNGVTFYYWPSCDVLKEKVTNPL